MSNIVDGYTHYASREYLEMFGRSSSKEARTVYTGMKQLSMKNPNLVDVESRLRDLERYGIDLQVAVPHDRENPCIYSFPAKEELELCRALNDCMADAMRASNRKMITLGAVPMRSLKTGEGIDEMERAMGELGLKGFLVPTNVGGTPIDRFEMLWEAADHLKAAVYIHPENAARGQYRPYEDEYDLMHVLAWPYETSLALTRLVFSGVLDRHPKLKIVSHHMGGMVPFFAGRLEESYSRSWTGLKEEQVDSAQRTRPLSEYLGMFYYDTAVGGSGAAIRCGLDVFGADHLIFSTDYPWGPDSGRGRLATYPRLVKRLDASARIKAKILSGNISKILGL